MKPFEIASCESCPVFFSEALLGAPLSLAVCGAAGSHGDGGKAGEAQFVLRQTSRCCTIPDAFTVHFHFILNHVQSFGGCSHDAGSSPRGTKFPAGHGVARV